MHILVTGAAGLIGGELCARLVAAGHTVSALVRSNRNVLANNGEPAAVTEVLTGDLARDGMGLDPATWQRLVQKTDLVLHCAALTRFDLAEQVYRATNIDGTARALDLAREAGAHFLHVSTAYVCGGRSGPIGEDDRLPQTGFTNGYEASKAAAERLVRGSGVPFVIARPSIVVGDSRTGAIRQFDTIYAAFRRIAEGHVRHLPVKEGASLDLVPLDHVAAGIVKLIEHFGTAQGAAYHLVSGGPVPVTEFAAAIGSFDCFDPPVLVDADGFDPMALPAIERRLFKRVAELYAAYFQRDPRFDDARLRAVTGLQAPPMDRALLHRLIRYCVEVGFLRISELQRISG